MLCVCQPCISVNVNFSLALNKEPGSYYKNNLRHADATCVPHFIGRYTGNLFPVIIEYCYIGILYLFCFEHFLYCTFSIPRHPFAMLTTPEARTARRNSANVFTVYRSTLAIQWNWWSLMRVYLSMRTTPCICTVTHSTWLEWIG